MPTGALRRRQAVALAAAAAAACVAVASAAARTPYPPPSGGRGAEPTAGSGTGAGVTFRPRAALATYDGDHYVLYLTPQPLACTEALLAKPPYLTVTIVGATPLALGPVANTGERRFVQVDFFVAPTHYYAIQPKVALVLTRLDGARGGVWHGRLTVPRTRFEGKTFSFAGTFAARWCGRV